MLNRRDEMRRFVTCVSENLEEECPKAISYDNMDFSRLIVHEQLRGED